MSNRDLFLANDFVVVLSRRDLRTASFVGLIIGEPGSYEKAAWHR